MTPNDDPDAWLEGVRRWYFGGNPPPDQADTLLPAPLDSNQRAPAQPAPGPGLRTPLPS